MLQESKKREQTFKVLVVGDIGTGKTSFIRSYIHHLFSIHYKATIGADFALKILEWDDDVRIKLQLWDIAGQERFGCMTRVYYRDAVGAFVLFDVTRHTTFEAVEKWKNDLDTKAFLPNGYLLPIILLANKCDQESLFDKEKIDELCKDQGFVGWFETSAKDNTNVDEAVHFMVNKVLEFKKEKYTDESYDKDSRGSMKLSPPPTSELNSRCCACHHDDQYSPLPEDTKRYEH